MRILSALALTAVLLLPAAARADGLIYQLPADGTSAEFDLKISFEGNNQKEKFDGSLVIKSVGKQKVDDVECRWIEFKLFMKLGDREQTDRAKVLVPDAELTRGKNPIGNVQKAWYKLGYREPREITDFSRGGAEPLPTFLSGPLKDAKELKAETVESSLGKLECKGVTGTTEYTADGRKNAIIFTNRLHEKAPFGIVSSVMEVEISRDGQVRQNVTMRLTLSKVGKDAKSELSDLN
jgi:hypothetical protein